MNEAAYVAVDWGTSSFRLWLIDQAGGVIAERRSHEGMMVAGKLGFASVLQSHLDAVGAGDALPVIVCGMAGARQGWVEAGYIDTPARLSAILEGAAPIPSQLRDMRVLPGIAHRNPGAPDVMRGEETQLLGALGLDSRGEVLVCMPGTHSKWVSVSDGRVECFATFMTGELFGVIARETILAHAVAGAEGTEDTDAFRSAVAAAFADPALATNLLFQVRARQLLYDGKASSARESISGTLIGLELSGGLSRETNALGVMLIASGRLQALYRMAFDTLSIPIQPIDADDAVLRGLSLAARTLWTP